MEASTHFDRKQRTVKVWNLSEHDSFSIYTNISPINALINEFLLNGTKASQLHNPLERDKALNMIQSGNKTFSIGELIVLKFGDD